MTYTVEAWEYPTDEEGGKHQPAEGLSCEFSGKWEALEYVWARLEEGYAVRMYTR